MKTRQNIRRVPFLAPVPVGLEVMSLARLRTMAPPGYLSAPQRPAFHLLILATAGATTHTVDFRRYRLAAGRTLWIRPGQVQRFGDPGDECTAELVLFQPDFMIPGTRAAALADDRFGPVALDHPADARARLARACRELEREYAAARATTAPASDDRIETLRHLLSLVILRLDAGDAVGETGDPDALYVRFREQLERDFTVAHDVDHYARALGYSSRTLARATGAATGETPKRAIQERLALEARRLLAHTNLAIATIAAQLGFRDPSNFSTFFTQHTGETPTAFRARQRAPVVNSFSTAVTDGDAAQPPHRLRA